MGDFSISIGGRDIGSSKTGPTTSATIDENINSRFENVLCLIECCKNAQKSTRQALTRVMKEVADAHPEDPALMSVTVDKLLERDESEWYSDPEMQAIASEGKAEKDKMISYLDTLVDMDFADFLSADNDFTGRGTRCLRYVEVEDLVEAVRKEDLKRNSFMEDQYRPQIADTEWPDNLVCMMVETGGSHMDLKNQSGQGPRQAFQDFLDGWEGADEKSTIVCSCDTISAGKGVGGGGLPTKERGVSIDLGGMSI
jgi:hypothetical protein